MKKADWIRTGCTFVMLATVLIAERDVWARGSVIAHFDLTTPMQETPTEIPPLFASQMPVSFKDMLTRMRDAREDRNVVAVVIEVEGAAVGFAQLEELRQAIKKFQAAGKPVYVHAESLSTRDYALATAASNITLVPTGDLWLIGMYGEGLYLRGMFDKMGIVPDFLQCGDFKSAGEIFMRTGPSKEAEAMENWLFDSLYDSCVSMIAEGRGWSADKVKALIDNGPYSAEDALKAGLIDAVEHRQDFIARLKSRYGNDVRIQRDYGSQDEEEMPTDFFGMMNKIMSALAGEKPRSNKPAIAVVYVEGAILTGSAEFSPFGGSEGAYSTTIRKGLDKAAEDDSIKGVVLRVDSPGGSALASEIILDAVRRVQKKGKPVIVSMGNVAGSGGYYVSCSGDVIFADATTITASIGVIGGKLVTTGGWQKLGINWHPYKRGKMAGMLSSATPFSDEERAKMKQYMDTVYAVFRKHVTDHRGGKLTRPLDDMAGGRVYTGEQALKLGLVDRIGTFADAVNCAAESLNLADFELRVLPEQPSLFEMLFGKGGKDEEYARNLMPSKSGTASFAEEIPVVQPLIELSRTLDPRRANTVLTALKQLELLHQERVIMMMSAEWVIR